MMLKRIYEDSSLTQLYAQINEDVSFKGIGIRISGTNGATAVALADVGRIQYIKRGQVVIDAGFDFLVALCQILGGWPNTTSTISGALDLYCYIPRRFFDNNVEHVTPSDNAQVKCTFNANLNTRVASGGKVEVYLDLEEGIQKYDLAIRQYSESVAGASVRPVTYEQPNILMALGSGIVSSVLTTASLAVTQIACEVGNFAADFSLGALTDNTNAQFNLESSYVVAGVLFFANGDITSRLFDNIRISFTTSGAASLETLLVSALFDNEKMVSSSVQAVDRLRSIMAVKAQKHDAETIAAINKISAVRSVN